MASFKMMMMTLVAYVVVVLLAFSDDAAGGTIGMNWGRQNAQRLVPSQVVDLLLQNGVGYARVYTSENDILEAFAGSGINLTVGVYNATVFPNIQEARRWVQRKSPYFSRSNVRAVAYGNSEFYKGLEDKNYLHSAIQSWQFLQTALNEDGHGDRIKATFQFSLGVLKDNITRPSEAEFLDEIKPEMIETLRFQQQNNASFFIEMFPLLDAPTTGNDISFAFVENKTSQHTVRDVNGAVYTNQFEFTYDCFVWALKKLNAPDMKIVVGQIGWPTDGYEGANATFAERFYKGLLPLVVSNKGTPMRPGPIDVFIQSLTDESLLPYTKWPFTRHWGIYRSNGEPKYKIDLTGQGRDIFPSRVRGIMRMPDRWCVFNGNKTDFKAVKDQFDRACEKADCTSLAPGGSCSQLSYEQNITYAFNMYFQFQFQAEKACDFNGLGAVSMNDPSTSECVFPVEVVRGQQLNVIIAGGVERRNCGSIFAFLISILGMLIVWD